VSGEEIRMARILALLDEWRPSALIAWTEASDALHTLWDAAAEAGYAGMPLPDKGRDLIDRARKAGVL
jgi:hypothetical protein